MKKRMKYMTVAAAAAVMMLGSFSISYATAGVKCPNCGYILTGTTTPGTTTPNTTTVKKGWVQTTVDKETIWQYYDNNGNMLTSQWFQSPSSGLWYYFDSDGTMVTGWGEGKVEGYWFDASGAMATGWRQISLEEEDTYGPGSGSSDKGYFYFDASGKVAEGWTRIGTAWYFLNDGFVDDFADYQMVYGEVEIDGDEYYFGESNDGSMKVGLVKVISETNSNTPSSKKEETYYLYKDNGVRVYDGWGKYNNVWYYADEDGEIVTDGFLALNRKDEIVDIDASDVYNVYYMDSKGVMKTGWLEMSQEKDIRPGATSGKVCYYFDSNGKMVTGWLKDGGKWYYLSPKKTDDYEKGQMVTGLYEMDDNAKNKYFFNTSGEMATSAWKEVEDESGSRQDIYLGEDGIMYRSEKNSLAIKKVKTKYYVFDENGYCLQTKGAIIIADGNKWRVCSDSEFESLSAGTKYYEIGSNGAAKESKK